MHFTAQLNWRPTIGDPTWVGWVTVLAYAVAAALAGRAALVRSPGEPDTERVIWLVITAALVFLGINKQLDLQTLFMEAGRSIAQSQGWYEHRRLFQMWFVVGITSAAVLFVGCFIFHFRAFWTSHRLLVAGLGSLIAFVVLRAVSFHHFDVFLHTTILGIRLHRLLELSGVLLVIVASSQELHARKGPSK
jgi:hypothetical protein